MSKKQPARNAKVMFRVTDEEKKLIEKAAHRDNRKPADFARISTLSAARKSHGPS